MNDNIIKYIKICDDSIDKLLSQDKKLLEVEIHEISIAHRLAIYIEQLLNDDNYTTDIEYNRYLKKPKKFPDDLKDEIYNIKQECKCCKNKSKKPRLTFRPDITVHKRGEENNLITFEIKKNTQCRFDEYKLKFLTNHDYQYGYKLGVQLFFQNKYPKINYYVNGEKRLI